MVQITPSMTKKSVINHQNYVNVRARSVIDDVNYAMYRVNLVIHLANYAIIRPKSGINRVEIMINAI